jgi:signal peptidase I
MKKTLKIILIIFVTYFSFSFIAKKTGILQFYKTPTLANEPNLKINTKFCVSNLVSPSIGDFVCYKYEDSLFGEHIRVHKLCGIENDIIEIKNGIVFLNGINIDENIEFVHFYKISKQKFEIIKKNEKLSEINQLYFIDENNIQISLEDLVAKKYGLTSKKQIEEKGKADKQISKVFKNNWNKDNFGPVKIPKGKLFVIGDNRDNSEDSRYIGFIDKTNIVGTVVFYN